MKLTERLKSINIDTGLQVIQSRFIRPMQERMRKHERTILDSHVVMRLGGYTINGIGALASSLGFIDWQTAATGLAIFNAIGMTYTWGTTACLVGSGNNTDMHRLISFTRRSVEQIWSNPQQGIEQTKEEIKQEAQKRPGLIGTGLRSALHTYNSIRRLPHMETTLAIARKTVENNINSLRNCAEATSPLIPVDYNVVIPKGEYRNPAEFKYGITASLWQYNNHNARKIRVHLYESKQQS